ncbi:MAG: ATP-binding protein [Chitinophagales bacterium]
MSVKNKNQERIKVPLNKLLLHSHDSPSTDTSQSMKVNYELIEGDVIQNSIFRYLCGDKNQYIENLLQSFKVNGYVEFHQIQVKETHNGYYFTLKGNRNVAALKFMERKFKDEDYDIGELNPKIFENVPVTLVKQKAKDIKLEFEDRGVNSNYNVFLKKITDVIKDLNKTQIVNYSNRLLTETSMPIDVIYDFPSSQLESISLKQYKHFAPNLEVGSFNKVNIIAGENNTGKTSFLEAINLLCHLNDVNGLYDVYQRRGKFLQGIPTEWFSKILPSKLNLSGVFDNKNCAIEIKKFIDNDATLDRTDYLSSVKLSATFNEEVLTTTTHLYDRKEAVLYYEKTKSICRIVMSNPFSLMDRQIIQHYHEIAVEKGVFNEIIAFIRNNIDDNIQDIDKVGEGSQFRFLVTHSNSSRADRTMDLTEFGDGVQRIFYISMMVAAAENGVLCIDEIENAIHHTLLVKFTKFLQILAERFNVQLFVSTHSNECIKAFFENDYKNEQITGFRLERKNGEVTYKKAVGRKLQLQIENFSLDLRG